MHREIECVAPDFPGSVGLLGAYLLGGLRGLTVSPDSISESDGPDSFSMCSCP